MPQVQQHELLAAGDLGDDEDEATLLRLSPAADLSHRARRAGRLVGDCNEAAKLAGKEAPFKPTTRSFVAAIAFPWLTPTNRQRLGESVDCLYFMLYEGAGAGQVRFLTEHGGVLDRADCEVIWAVNVLRNKWLRHDADRRAGTAIYCWVGTGQGPSRPANESPMPIQKRTVTRRTVRRLV